MSEHRFDLVVDVDDAKLILHDGNRTAPPNDVEDWEASDIFTAARLGIVNPADCRVEDYTHLRPVVYVAHNRGDKIQPCKDLHTAFEWIKSQLSADIWTSGPEESGPGRYVVRLGKATAGLVYPVEISQVATWFIEVKNILGA
jgi:hypothetical protein